MQEKQDKAARLNKLLSYLRQDPNNDRLRVDVFETALAAGEFPEAQFQLVHARHLRPQDMAWRHREAVLQLAQGKFAAAQDTLERLIEEGCDESSAHYNLAYAVYAQGAAAAARDMAAPLRAVPGEVGASAWALWLRCLHKLNELDEGLRGFRAETRPPSAETLGVASLMALDAGLAADADRWAALALSRAPDQLEALTTAGSLALGRQDKAAAEALFQRALLASPKEGRCWSGLAFLRLLETDFAAAHAAFEQAIAFMPEHIGTWLGLGWCEFFAGDAEAARQTFEKALSMDRNFGESHGSLAVALVRLNAIDAAKREIDLALRLDRRNLSARYAEALISGEANDPEAFRRLSQRVLAQRQAPLGAGSLADLLRPGK